jgi:D-sedoheptulose 7-phosphate isomerase
MSGRLARERMAHSHLAALIRALDDVADRVSTLDAWGRAIANTLTGGGRLLAAGNGGSAAHAQHLVSELVGRYRDERPPMSAIALTAEPSTVTAIVNDYGIEEMFARQVLAHGRPGDFFVGFSTSGRSANVVAAARVARREGLRTLAFTGARPSALAQVCDDVFAVHARATATVQEVHQVAVHLVCEAVDDELRTYRGAPVARVIS